jgi:hypothetical protein
MPPLVVFAVVAANDYRRARAVAVRLSVEEAKQLAESLESDRKFEWRDFPDGAFIEGGYPDGPLYSYSIEPIEVRIKQ